MNAPKSEERLREGLEQVKAILERYQVLENLAHIQQGPKRDLLEALTHRQNLADLQKKVGSLHPADLAYVLEGLPPQPEAFAENRRRNLGLE